MNKTLYHKLYEKHIIHDRNNTNPILYIDLHLIHEVTSPQAFDALRIKNRTVRQPKKTFATMDHNVSTTDRNIKNSEEMAKKQMEQLQINCKEFNIPIYDLNHPNQGIVHIIGPELGMSLPGMTIVCGDSHTSTHGAFGTLSFGIGTSEVEHVLATQTLKQSKLKTMLIIINGKKNHGITAKDIILAIIRKIGSSGGTGYVIEFSGDVVTCMSMEERMTICNMAIEMGAKSGIIAPDETTFLYLKNRTFSPKKEKWNQAIKYWRTLKSDKNAKFDQIISLNISNLHPQITWGTNPGQVISITEKIPDIDSFKNIYEKESAKQALIYMGLLPGKYLKDIKIDKVFIGSCTNARIEDLRLAAKIAKQGHVNKHVQAIVVPGSGTVKRQAEKEGLDEIFINSGFEWRLPGCSMCLGMNNDRLKPKERCASTSNRNFEGRQGRGGRTHLVSPLMAAAAALFGRFVDARDLLL